MKTKLFGVEVFRYKDRESWMNGRLGKITGSKLRGIYSTSGRKVGSYELIAESILGSEALAEDEDPMIRGTRLEKESVARFRQETGKKVDDSLLLWVSNKDNRIAYSPDGVISTTAALETKSLSAARHLEARITGRIPAEYKPQALEAFICNDKLKTLFFCFFDPRFPKPLDFFFFELTRKSLQKEITIYESYIVDELKWIRDQVNALTLYSPEEIARIEAVKQELLAPVAEAHKTSLDRVYASIKERSI